jgi:hypothetical protein
MDVPVLVVIGPRRQPPDKPHLLTIEQCVGLSAKKRTGQIGGGEIVFGRCLGPERSTLYARRHASLNVDDARSLEKQQIARESRVL